MTVPIRCLLVVLGLAVGVAAQGRHWVVTNATDGKGEEFSCPGPSCNLRRAWGLMEVHDWIELTVDPAMTLGPLQTPNIQGQGNGTVSLTGPSNASAHAVVTGNGRIFQLDNWQFGQGSVYVTLSIQSIDFVGIKVKGDGLPGIVICISTGGTCSSPTVGIRAGGEGRDGAIDTPDALQSSDTRWGNWSQFTELPGLHITACDFRGNSYGGSTTIFAGIIVAWITLGSGVLPVYVQLSTFADTHVDGQSPAGVAIQSEWSNINAAVPVVVTHSAFTNNQQDTTAQPPSIRGYLDGPVIGASGPISLSGCSFVGNTLGATRAVVSASPQDAPYHVVIRDTVFSRNMPNSIPTTKMNATIVGSWIVMTGVTMSVPDTSTNIAAFSPNDQYFVDCALSSPNGRELELDGYQIYNKNPVFLNLTSSGSLGFANCSQSRPWVPCPKESTCTGVLNTHATLVGVRCD